MHIVRWLKYLKKEEVIMSFTYNKLGNNLGERYRILQRIIDGEPQNRGHVFIVTGYNTTHEVVLKKLKKRIREKKRELDEDEPMHPVAIMLRNTIDEKTCNSAKLSKNDKSCHAICLKVDNEGQCWLYDPGKTRVKLISKEPKLFDQFIHSLFDVYLVHKFEIRFA